MFISRRAALLRGVSLACAAPLLLAACAGGNPLGTTITVNLAGAQAEADAILAALNVVASAATVTMSTALQAMITADLSSLGVAVTAFSGLPSGTTTVASFANAVIAAVSKVIAVLPLASATSLAIKEGLALISALVAGLSTITVTTPSTTTPAVGATPVRVFTAPIPIPVA